VSKQGGAAFITLPSIIVTVNERQMDEGQRQQYLTPDEEKASV
jgi:hypothetical protein